MGGLNEAGVTEITELKQKTVGMLELVGVMFRTSFDGLMKHDIDILDRVLADEKRIIEIYNNLMTFIVEISKKNVSAEAKKTVRDLTDIICTIEKMAYRCVDLVERIEYKIRENLLFSEEAVQEYKDLHGNVDRVLSNTIETIKTRDKKLAGKVLEDRSLVDALVAKYRINHIDRSARGLCDEWAKIRYLDMLDFTGEIAHYCADIADKCLKDF